MVIMYESGFIDTQLNTGSVEAEIQMREGLCIPNFNTFVSGFMDTQLN